MYNIVVLPLCQQEVASKQVIYTWKMLAPYGVRQALSRLSLPVLANHLPQLANFSDRTQLSWRCNWYLSGLDWCRTSTLLLSILNTHTHTPLSILTAIFPAGHGLAGFTEAKVMEVVVTTGAKCRAKLRSNRHHQQTNTCN